MREALSVPGKTGIILNPAQFDANKKFFGNGKVA
jgi:hypothetical protein